MAQTFDRRSLLTLLAGAPWLAMPGWASAAQSRRVVGLIEQAKALPNISRRIEAISRALIGTRYAAHTLIGGPRRDEVFVVREDAFDCVTYNEFVLAAAMARDLPGFETALRNIRYRNGEVAWRERNHYYADWSRNNIENGVCRAVELGETVKLDKSSNSEPGLGRRSWTLDVTPQAVLLANAAKLLAGDIVGFVSRRANLDYFHTGFVAFGNKDELLLRHASSAHHRVVNEPMRRFIAINGVKYVTVLRPQEVAVTQRATSAVPV